MILSWLQVNGQETNRIVHASVKKHYEEKKEALENSVNIFGGNCTHYTYDCHDLKMMYCLLGKVNLNNGFGSNLLCGCPKRLGVIENKKHECVLMSDKVQKQKYWSAKAHFNALIAAGEDEVLARENTNK